MERVLAAKHRRLERLRLQLEERSPLSVLARGYAICYDAQGRVVHAAEDVSLGDSIRVQLSREKIALPRSGDARPGKSLKMPSSAFTATSPSERSEESAFPSAFVLCPQRVPVGPAAKEPSHSIVVG